MTTTLVLGGARSGKSRYAEQLLAGESTVRYVAPGPVPDPRSADPDDRAWAARIAEHRSRRPPGWETVEGTDLAGALRAATGPVLIDCLGTWLTAVIDDLDGWDDPVATAAALRTPVEELVGLWQGIDVPVVAVTNEVGWGVVPATASGRLFRDELGRLNTRLAGVSDRVVLVVAGRVLDLSDAPVVGA